MLCLTASFPSCESNVHMLNSTSSLTIVLRSQTFPFIIPQKAFLARPSLIDLAMSKTDIPASNSLTDPSFKVTLIILNLLSNK